MSISFPSADFAPTLSGYTGQGAFRFWCQKVLPIVYDDSLSYYELLNKVVNYLNNVISDVATLEDNVGLLNESYSSLQEYVNGHMQELVSAFNELQTFVDTYFENLDVQNEINNKLDEMATSGVLGNVIEPLIATAIPDVVSEWLKENITPTSPAVDATLTVSGAAADAKVVGDKFDGLTSDFVGRFYGGKVSIIGDSLSAFDDPAYMTPNYKQYYPMFNVTDVKQMWWYKVMSVCNMSFEKNVSFSGSCVTNIRADEGYPDFYDRCGLLGEPDIIFVALGSSDSTRGAEFGEFDFDVSVSELDESKFRPAYIKGVKTLISNYPSAKIYCLSAKMARGYKESIDRICSQLGVTYIDIGDYLAVSSVHANAQGQFEMSVNTLYGTDRTFHYNAIPADSQAVGDIISDIVNANSIKIMNEDEIESSVSAGINYDVDGDVVHVYGSAIGTSSLQIWRRRLRFPEFCEVGDTVYVDFTSQKVACAVYGVLNDENVAPPLFFSRRPGFFTVPSGLTGLGCYLYVLSNQQNIDEYVNLPVISKDITHDFIEKNANDLGQYGVGVEPISGAINGYVNVGIVDVGEVVNVNSRVISSATYSFMFTVTECNEGDVFTINATGTGAPRPYAFLDAEYKLLYKAPAGTFTDHVVTAPVGAKYLIINNNTPTVSYKGVTFRAFYKQNEQLINWTESENPVQRKFGVDLLNSGYLHSFNGMTFVGNKLLVFTASNDAHTNYSYVGVFNVDFDNETIAYEKHLNHNLGHCNTVDYNEQNDTLVLGNGGTSDNTENDQIIIIPGFSAVLARSNNSNIEYSGDCRVIDLDNADEDWGKQVNVCWSRIDDKIVICLSNDGDNRYVRKVLLGNGDTVLEKGTPSWTTGFNGTFKVLSVYKGEYSTKIANNDTQVYGDVIYEISGHYGVNINKIKVGNNKISVDSNRCNIYSDEGDILNFVCEGVAIKNGLLFSGGYVYTDNTFRVLRIDAYVV